MPELAQNAAHHQYMPARAQSAALCYNMPVRTHDARTHTKESEHIMRRRVTSVEDLGQELRRARKCQGMTQKELTDFFSTFSREFLSDLENGKPSVEMGKALAAAHSLGLQIYVESAVEAQSRVSS